MTEEQPHVLTVAFHLYIKLYENGVCDLIFLRVLQTESSDDKK